MIGWGRATLVPQWVQAGVYQDGREQVVAWVLVARGAMVGIMDDM